MERRKLLIGLAAVPAIALLAVAGMQAAENSDRPGAEAAMETGGQFNTTEDGTRYTVHPSQLQQGCPSMDCIPSIDDPTYEEAGQAGWMNPEDEVLGIELNGDAKAYPLKIMDVHEIVNTEVGGEPTVVTYCPLCRSGVAFNREVDGEVLEFGVSGKLRNANLVMYDRGTESYWSQIGGNAIVGPMVPKKLELRHSSVTSWEEWKRGHPDTKVLSRDTGIYPSSRYESRQYAGYQESGSVGFGVGEVDSRLEPKQIVYGIKAGDSSKAYPAERLEKGEAVNDRVGDTPVVILERPDDGTVTAFRREFERETLNLTASEEGLTDSQGRTWSFDGELSGGEGSLERLEPQEFYWFAWEKFNRNTEVYKG